MSTLKYPFLDLRTVNDVQLYEIKDAALRVIESGRYIGGDELEAFEQELAKSCGAAHAVGVSNGLDALRLIFKAFILLGYLSPGDEVIVPANTYIASILAITHAGLKPILIEPSTETLNLDTSIIESHITPRTRAILTVHLYGRTCFDAELAECVKRHKLLLVEDNAQAIGAHSDIPSSWNTDTTGSLGHAAAFSFYPTKNIGALGDAGAVTTQLPELANAVRALANYGSDTRYHNIYQGYNCRLDPIQAAILRCKLPYIGATNAHRAELAAEYSHRIDNPLITTPQPGKAGTHVWHQYVILTPYRDALRNYLTEQGVGTDIHYAVPPHLQPCYSSLEHGPLPITEALASQVLSLPISACTSLKDAAEIADIINRFII